MGEETLCVKSLKFCFDLILEREDINSTKLVLM